MLDEVCLVERRMFAKLLKDANLTRLNLGRHQLQAQAMRVKKIGRCAGAEKPRKIWHLSFMKIEICEKLLQL